MRSYGGHTGTVMGGFVFYQRRALVGVSSLLKLAGTGVLLSGVLVFGVLALGGGCAVGGDESPPGPESAALHGGLHVLVAASLLPVTEVLAAEFERTHPSVEVLIWGAGSSALREQVLAGAPADVFIPADPSHFEAIRNDIGLAGTPVVVARNSLVLAVPASSDTASNNSNNTDIASLADLSRRELLIGLCAAEVPCGAHARAGLSRAGIKPATDTDEPNVRALVTKLAAGELDAAVVYASDAHTVEGIKSLGWTAGAAPETVYEAAVLTGAPNPATAAAFVKFLLSAAAQNALANHGFRVP